MKTIPVDYGVSFHDNIESYEKIEVYEKLLCWKIGPLRRRSHFLFCTFWVLFFHIISGLLQEAIFSSQELKTHGLFLTTILMAFNFLFSLTESLIENNFEFPTIKSDIRILILFGIFLGGTIGLSNYSLRYLNYTAQVMFKCCKPIPVLIGGLIVQNKKFTAKKIASCSLITLGIVWYSIADAKVSPSFQLAGVVIIICALMIDAITPNIQEKLMKDYKCSILETLMFPYVSGAVTLLIAEVVISDLTPALKQFFENPFSIMIKCFLQSLCNYVGVYYVVSIMKHFGALEASLVTNFRKLATVTLSYIYFEKPFTIQYIYSIALIFLGLTIDAVEFETLFYWLKELKSFLLKKFSLKNKILYPV